MKTSTYNIFFDYQDKKIGYNALSNEFIILEPILYDLLLTSISSNLQKLYNTHKSLYDTLVDKEFIIAEEKNELEYIKQISFKTDFNNEYYRLTVNPTMNCNFKCWYCYEEHIKGSKMNSKTLKNIVSHIDNVLIEKQGILKFFSLTWFGGEPMLYFDKVVLPILKEVYPKMQDNKINFSSSFTTNGLLINQNILNECKKYGVKSFQITLDGDRVRHDKVRFISKTKGSYDKIVKNIKLCLQNKFYVSARINISEDTIPGLLNLKNDFLDISSESKKYLTFNFQKVWQEEKDLSKEMHNIEDKFKSLGVAFSHETAEACIIRDSCYADKKNQATINYNGEVFKCTARDFTTKNKDGDLMDDGSIKWNDKKYQLRMHKSRFSNPTCLECNILPLCNGGCSQKRMETYGKNFCILGFDKNDKLNMVKDIFYNRMAMEVSSQKTKASSIKQ